MSTAREGVQEERSVIGLPLCYSWKIINLLDDFKRFLRKDSILWCAMGTERATRPKSARGEIYRSSD